MKDSDKILALCAMFVSICALVVSVYQTKMLSQEKDAAVWPYIQIKFSMGHDYFVISAANDGIGPAIIQEMNYLYGDSTFARINHLADFVVKQTRDSSLINASYGYTNVETKGSVIKGGETKDILKFKNFPGIIDKLALYDKKFVPTVKYCSIYKKCWQNIDNDITSVSK